MSNAWFRMYHEFATNAKVQMLSHSDQRCYVMLLCLRCQDSRPQTDSSLAFQLRVTESEYHDSKTRLIEQNLIDENSQPIAWDGGADHE